MCEEIVLLYLGLRCVVDIFQLLFELPLFSKSLLKGAKEEKR